MYVLPICRLCFIPWYTMVRQLLIVHGHWLHAFQSTADHLIFFMIFCLLGFVEIESRYNLRISIVVENEGRICRINMFNSGAVEKFTD